MSNTSAGDNGPFSAGKVVLLVVAGAKLLAIPTCPALAAALLGAAVATHLPPHIRGQIRRSYAVAKELIRQRVITTSVKLRAFMRQAGAKIRVWVANGVLTVAIWVAFAGEVLQQFIDTVKLSAEIWQQPMDGVPFSSWAATAAA